MRRFGARPSRAPQKNPQHPPRRNAGRRAPLALRRCGRCGTGGDAQRVAAARHRLHRRLILETADETSLMDVSC